MLNSRALARVSSSLRRPRDHRRHLLGSPTTSSRSYHNFASNSWLGSIATGTSATTNVESNDGHPYQHQQSYYRLQQVRFMGRKAGASADDPKHRRSSKKQKRRFRRKMEKERELEKHNPPGSKAGKRREYVAETDKQMMNEYQEKLDGSYYEKKMLASHPLNDPSLDYTQDDALLDDLIGNAGGDSSWTSQPTPEPIYYGNRQRAFFNRVVDQMDVYRDEVQLLEAGGTNDKAVLPSHLLPTDKEISLAVRAYRDQQGTRTRPIGIAKALQHVLKDLGIPSTSVFGEYTYNALLSCCRTPGEGLRVFELMQQHQHQISAYSFAILVDIHAKVGDFEGCVRVLDEMHAEGHPPNLAAYTSLLAACYKVCNDGRIAHSIRAKAGNVGWEKWQELRVKGLEPDVMCYGAILRLCAARGQPERCLNLLEEMPRFDVQPTTLCFSSALQAVAKSHETAIRYERGWSRKNKRRERIAAHHGKITRSVVILAESANVEMEDGFVSALQLCAAAAGDSATAKAIYLADKVRRNMKHWRQIGGEDHLMRLRGEDPEAQHLLQGSSSGHSLKLTAGSSAEAAVGYPRDSKKKGEMSYGEREYGTDTRTLSAILRACAQASDSNGVGKMWSGGENYGYLDLTSLRLIQQYRRPEFRNTDIPGMSRTEVGMGTLVSLDDLQNPRKRTDPELRRGGRRKFPGMVTLDEAGTGLDDLPGDLHDIYFDEDGMLKQKYIDTGLYPEYERVQEQARRQAEAESRALARGDDTPQVQIEAGDVAREEMVTGDTRTVKKEEATPMYFCADERRWKTGYPETREEPERAAASTAGSAKTHLLDKDAETQKEEEEWYFDADARRWATRPKVASPMTKTDGSGLQFQEGSEEEENSVDDMDEKEEWYFDSDERRWKSQIAPLARGNAKTEFEFQAQNQSSPLSDSGGDKEETEFDDKRLPSAFSNAQEAEESFQMFFQQLKDEVAEDGDDMTVDEVEARELFAMMSDEYSSGELQKMFDEEEDEEEDEEVLEESEEGEEVLEESDAAIPTLARGRSASKKDFNQIMDELQEDWGEDLDIDVDDWSDDDMHEDNKMNSDFSAMAKDATSMDHERLPSGARVMEMEREGMQQDGAIAPFQTVESYLQENQQQNDLLETFDDDLDLEELQQLLPGMPISRLQRVRQAYVENLSDPSFLTLVPILREKMPDWFTTQSLRAANIETARFVMNKAEEAGLVDTPMLNGMLQVYSASGSTRSALDVYEKFDKYKLKPTAYSNRLVVQLFLQKKQLSNCLHFKQKVEEGGQKLDLLSYGALMEYCGRHKQLGSAILMLKECIELHGAPPGESYLKELRLLCGQAGLEEQVALEAMIGEDPIKWLRHGEAVLKRENSKKGRRDVQLARNALLRA